MSGKGSHVYNSHRKKAAVWREHGGNIVTLQELSQRSEGVAERK